jgi:sulfatase modifying factor 1
MPTSRERATRGRYQSTPWCWALTCLALGACDGSRAPASSSAAEAREAPSSEAPSRAEVPGGILTHEGVRHAVAPFEIDRTLVTRAQFERFVEATGHVTGAEREGDGSVLDLASGRWSVVRGASFRFPRGPDAEAAPSDHPATQITLEDAEAYCAWAGGRVPTELEWEHAARNGRDDRSAYPWGDELHPGGRARANTWEGAFPAANTLRDGHLFTSPVDAFPPSPLGLHDIVGNVWHWTRSPFDAESDAVALRGGSHLCDPDVCHGFRIDGRQRAERGERLAHVGLRCVYVSGADRSPSGPAD